MNEYSGPLYYVMILRKNGNKEVKIMFASTILNWASVVLEKTDFTGLYDFAGLTYQTMEENGLEIEHTTKELSVEEEVSIAEEVINAYDEKHRIFAYPLKNAKAFLECIEYEKDAELLEEARKLVNENQVA